MRRYKSHLFKNLEKDLGLFHMWTNVMSDEICVEVNPNFNSWYIPFRHNNYKLIIDEYTFRSLKYK